MSFSFGKQKNGKMSFLDVEISQENGKFVITVYCKPTVSGFRLILRSFYLLNTNLVCFIP